MKKNIDKTFNNKEERDEIVIGVLRQFFIDWQIKFDNNEDVFVDGKMEGVNDLFGEIRQALSLYTKEIKKKIKKVK